MAAFLLLLSCLCFSSRCYCVRLIISFCLWAFVNFLLYSGVLFYFPVDALLIFLCFMNVFAQLPRVIRVSAYFFLRLFSFLFSFWALADLNNVFSVFVYHFTYYSLLISVIPQRMSFIMWNETLFFIYAVIALGKRRFTEVIVKSRHINNSK